MTFIYAKHFARVSSAVTFNTVSLVVLLDSREIPIRQDGQAAGAPLLILSEIRTDECICHGKDRKARAVM